MFAPTKDITTDQPRATWRHSVWSAVDRAVAFLTLDAYGVEVSHGAVEASGDACRPGPRGAHSLPRRPAPPLTPAPARQTRTASGPRRPSHPRSAPAASAPARRR